MTHVAAVLDIALQFHLMCWSAPVGRLTQAKRREDAIPPTSATFNVDGQDSAAFQVIADMSTSPLEKMSYELDRNIGKLRDAVDEVINGVSVASVEAVRTFKTLSTALDGWDT